MEAWPINVWTFFGLNRAGVPQGVKAVFGFPGFRDDASSQLKGTEAVLQDATVGEDSP